MKADGKYTLPRSWGVYRVTPGAPASASLFHHGNHPVRQRELRREYPAGPVELLHLFPTKKLANELMELLNCDPAAAAGI